MAREQGGKTVYGASVGILMLETRFPRIKGDLGHAGTWDFPVHYRVVRGASAQKAVREDPAALSDLFIEAGRDLVAMGCDGITTSCGFLSLIQPQLAEALDVPVAASALMQVPMIDALLPPGQRTGIVTISSETLTPDHLRAAGVALDTPVMGTEGGQAITRDILEDRAEADTGLWRADVVDAAQRLVSQNPEVGAILLECTNMVPFAPDVHRATGRPVYSIFTLVQWFQAGLSPRNFTA